MGQRPSCYRDKTVGFTRADWLNHVAEKDTEIERLEDVVAALQAEREGGELIPLDDVKAEMSPTRENETEVKNG